MAFDAITPTRFGAAELAITPLLSTIRTTPALTLDLLKDFDIANNGTGTAFVSVYLVPAGGSPDSSNLLIPGVRLPPASVFQWSGTQVLDAGATIQAKSTLANVTMTASGGNAA